MDFFEKLKETVAGATKTAVDKSNEIVEVTKIKFAIRDMENETEKLLREIGEAVYNSVKSGNDPSEIIEAHCKEIDTKYEEITALREKLRAYKNIKLCSGCGCEVAEDSVFCSKCGEKMN